MFSIWVEKVAVARTIVMMKMEDPIKEEKPIVDDPYIIPVTEEKKIGDELLNERKVTPATLEDHFNFEFSSDILGIK